MKALQRLCVVLALMAVAAGGWSLIDFSQRRIRFVSAVTHELRTPLTTIRNRLALAMNRIPIALLSLLCAGSLFAPTLRRLTSLQPTHSRLRPDRRPVRFHPAHRFLPLTAD